MEHLLYISQQTATASHTDNIRAACDAGCRWIQLRVKSPDNALREQLAHEAKTICDEYGALLSINDHPALAAAVNAYGAHVGKDDMPVQQARAVAGTHSWLGGTANTLDDVLTHVAGGADYIGMGPYRFTTTKEKLSPVLGLEGYQQTIAHLRKMDVHIPVVAIGGILLEDIPGLKAAGVSGIAVSGLITHAVNKKRVVEQIKQLWMD
ncbi:thiamine phosphate synthase [Chitinophaga cymbidii]|uniref:Thiamine-phosphate synthase n=1 Tax=Chitinophaga cymbidii TaxID=1096750 RepID=A0A512RHA5_9BACT|nr:thiamine phosphate synthase [Chitinophaga cymbidii]GEP95073.1 thiamine-phosphate synthase [Chitinophaga cymbidii]